MKFSKAAIVLNGFIHDFTTGYWLSCIIAIYLLNGFQQQYPAVVAVLNQIEHFFFWNSIGAVVVILATGAGRTFTYVDNVYGETTEKVRRNMLILKHVILLSLFGAGGYWAYLMTFR